MTTAGQGSQFPWLDGLPPLSPEEEAATDNQARVLNEDSDANTSRNLQLNQLLIEQYNSRNDTDDPAPRLMTVDVETEREIVQQLAFDQLVVRTSQLQGVMDTLTEAGYTVPRDENDPLPRTQVVELAGRVTLLRVQRDGVYLSADELREPLQKLLDAGFDASLNHCVPLGYTVKSVVGDVGPTPSHASPLTRPEALATFQPEGPGVKIAVIDTGLADERRRDQWLDDVAFGPKDVDPVFTDPQRTVIGDIAGHGNFVTGIIRQVEPSADIRMDGVFGPEVVASDVRVAIAVWRAVRHGARIVNISLGTTTLGQRPTVAIWVALELIAENFADDPVVVVCAAGNNRDETRVYPAALTAITAFSELGSGVRVVAVGGLELDSTGADFSSRGDWVTCSAIARRVLSTFVMGDQDLGNGQIVTYGPDPWALWTGTSFAAPQVAGAIARTCREQHKTPVEALESLLAGGNAVSKFGQALEILPIR